MDVKTKAEFDEAVSVGNALVEVGPHSEQHLHAGTQHLTCGLPKPTVNRIPCLSPALCLSACHRCVAFSILLHQFHIAVSLR